MIMRETAPRFGDGFEQEPIPLFLRATASGVIVDDYGRTDVERLICHWRSQLLRR